MGPILLGILLIVWTLSYGLVLSYIVLWVANLFNYIISIPTGWIGLLLGQLISNSPGVVQFIHLFLTMGLAYCLLYYVLFCLMTREDSLLEDTLDDIFNNFTTPKVIRYSLIFIVTIIVVAVCDTRVDQFMPDQILAAVEYIRHEFSAFILAPIDLIALDSPGGGGLTAMHFNVFDTSIVIAVIVTLIHNYFDF